MKWMSLPERLRTELERLGALSPRLELFPGRPQGSANHPSVGRSRALPARPVLVAVSGGRDSVALLHLAHRIGLEIAVAHLDHGMREGSSEDAVFVRELCTSLSVPFQQEFVDAPAIAEQRGWGLEEAARTLRYAFLRRIARRLDSRAILTAHTLDDNAETVMMQLLRGTARATGIPPRRDRILRPLLGTARAELEAYLLEHELVWREDPSNRDTRFNRNWLRLEVMPLLEMRFPGASQTLARYTQVSRAEDELLEELTELVPPWASWRFEAVAVQRRLIRRLLEAAHLRTDLEHIESLRDALERTGTGTAERMSLPDDHTGLVQDGRAYVFDKHRQIKGTPPPEVRIRAHEVPDDLDFHLFPWAKLRTWQPGDRIRLSGGTRKLSELLRDRRLPREMRERVPIVAQHSEVLWIGLDPPITDIRIAQTRDLEFEAMGEAIRLAQEGFIEGEVPVGAVVLRGQEIVGRGRNRSRTVGDMTMHAELEAIRDAAQRLSTPYLSDCALIVTLEPCPMCLGAALESRLARIVFGASNDRSGALGGVIGALRAPWLALHRPEVRPRVRAKECTALLTTFFERVRQERTDGHEKP